jgi:hypothetical protein
MTIKEEKEKVTIVQKGKNDAKNNKDDKNVQRRSDR